MMTVPRVLALTLFAAVGTFASWAPPKYLWPPRFDVGFGLSVPSAGISNLTCHMYYDWAAQAQTIDYLDQCLPGLGVEGPCRLIFDPSGIWMTKPTGGDPSCCLLVPDVGVERIDFLTPFNYSNNETATDWFGNSYECYHWLGSGGFEYWTTPGQTDIKLRDGETTFWNYGPFNVRPQNQSNFALPKNSCLSNCAPPPQSRSKMALRKQSLAHLAKVRGMFFARQPNQ